MPELQMESGMFEDVVAPAFKFVLSLVIANTPTVVYFVLTEFEFLEPNPLVLAVWAAFGIFFWPMVVLMLALGCWPMLLRPDRLLWTIVLSFSAYLAVWLALLPAFSIWLMGFARPVLMELGIEDTLSDWWIETAVIGGGQYPWQALLVLILGVPLLKTYLTLVSMRIVGLYYLHFKHRFPFRLE
jgi:hypothetical protein